MKKQELAELIAHNKDVKIIGGGWNEITERGWIEVLPLNSEEPKSVRLYTK